MNREAIQSVLQQPYQRDRWLEILRAVLPATELFASPQTVQAGSRAESILQLGRVRLHGGNRLAVLEVALGGGVQLTRNRVGLRAMVARLIDQAEYHGILAIFNSSDSSDYRFTFAARQSVFDSAGTLSDRETAPRRFTYVLGPNETCRTAAERFFQLAGKAHDAGLADIIDAFSVEKLNNEFFADFVREFGNVRDEIARRHRSSDATVKSEAQTLLNRLLFLYFVQRKGWLNRQRNYLIRNYRDGHENNPKSTSYHTLFLRPLFQRLSTEEASSLLPGHQVPFLNGGLFNDEFGDDQSDPLSRRRKELMLSNEIFGHIFEHLLEPYNFTIHEDSPNNYEVAIDPEMLGRIFEALVLQGEESDAGGKSARHDSGSHYTPRPIVHYICRETLAAWLVDLEPFAHKHDQVRIDKLLGMDVSDGIDEAMHLRLDEYLTPDESADLRDRVFELRACDPAVGSGAFPMGLLHELVNLIRLCETRVRGKDPVEHDSRWLYQTKKQIIERALYGVDNQERAIEICKLRLWLSLMVDHELDVDPENCEARAFGKALKDLDPLPNLDFKIRRANSLVDCIHGEPIALEGPFEPGDTTYPILSRLVVAKQGFYAARTAKEKRRLRLAIHQATAELAKEELGWALSKRRGLFLDDAVRAEELDRAVEQVESVLAQIRAARKARADEQKDALEHIQEWFDDPSKPTFVWRFDFAEVFHWHGPDDQSPLRSKAAQGTGGVNRRGFDIVIGNPPYVRIQTLIKTDPKAAAYYKEHYRAAKKGNYDIYVVFVERGLNLLAGRGGQLGYILPHKFFNAQYGEPLRALISRGRYLRHVVHFGDQQIFPGATNYVCLLFLSNSPVEETRFVRADDLKLWLATRKGIEGCVASDRLSSTEWIFNVGKSASVFERLAGLPVKLGDLAERISQGIRTSANEVFVLNVHGEVGRHLEAYSESLAEEVTLEREAVYQFLGGREIKPYRLLPSGKVVIIPYRLSGTRMVLISSKEYEAKYLNTWKYLLRNRRFLEGREGGKMKGDRWYGFVYPKNLEVMTSPKLLVPDIADRASFALDENGIFAFTSGYGITLKPKAELSLKFVLGVANSRALDFYWRQISTPLRGGFFRYFTQYIEQLPIPTASSAQQHQVEQLVDYLLSLHPHSSVEGTDLKRPQDPAMVSFFEQLLNALVYELLFSEDLRKSNLCFFNLLEGIRMPQLSSFANEPQLRLQGLFDLFQRLQLPGAPLRIALDKLQTLDLVRVIENS